MAVIGYWITPGFEKREALLEFMELVGPHSGENMTFAVVNLLQELDIAPKILTITGDNAGNNGTMCDTLHVALSKLYDDEDTEFRLRHLMRFHGRSSFIRCLAHIINLICKDILSHFSAGSVREAKATLDQISVAKSQLPLNLGSDTSRDSYMFDRWCSASNNISRKMDNFDELVDLPMDESFFYGLKADQTHDCEHAVPGLWAYMVTIAKLFGSIQDINRRIVQGVDHEVTNNLVASLAVRLGTWEADLPPTVRLNRKNLLAFRAKGLGGSYIALHLGFYHYATVLYYQYLDIDSREISGRNDNAAQCRHFALLQSSSLRAARDLGECNCCSWCQTHSRDIFVGAVTYTTL